ncbi:MAG: SMC family ATPase [Anaerolineales bacterium]|nr:SMC family ATPase [Anaerolineales bacterium]
MIPIKLHLSGFLSYQDPVELDFTNFNLACISGSNGSGKSSLLEAFTWALFGQARKSDESMINLQSETAEVSLIFSYESVIYQVLRSKRRGKNTVLEFQIAEGRKKDAYVWKPLSERTLRETQARIEETLRLDYDTFVNAAFFLQGKADQFTQQNASKRKDVLGNVLGLEVWEHYREKSANHRKRIERELGEVDGRMAEINAELAEEPVRKANQAELEARLGELTAQRKSREANLENMKQMAASLNEQRKLAASLTASLERSQVLLAELLDRFTERENEQKKLTELLERADLVEADYQKWKKVQAEIERLEKVASEFREHEAHRQPLLERISNERVRLEQESSLLKDQENEVKNLSKSLKNLTIEKETLQAALKDLETRLAARTELDHTLQATRQEQAERKAENEHLKVEMAQHKARIEQLESSKGALCPLCGQPLSPEERKTLIEQLNTEGTQMGDQFRRNKALLDELSNNIKVLEKEIAGVGKVEEQRVSQTALVSKVTSQLEYLQQRISEWEEQGQPRWKEIKTILEKETYAAVIRTELAELDKRLKALGYDAANHDAARKTENELRQVEDSYLKLETARAALKPLEREINNIQNEIDDQKKLVASQEVELKQAAESLSKADEQAPDINNAEQDLFQLQEQENRLNQAVGAARQKVTVLEDLRGRNQEYQHQREIFGKQIGRYKILERAFGKDGIPALLIEQALPQIETKANDLLDRLSNGTMSIRFVTQSEYKDKKREDLRETLEIQISDGAGIRDYEMYSGGEAFRINFAIRLALSEVLAQRKGARLQTLVIDEGFGSQDTQGRQRLIEAINQVKDDFEIILVITHLDELKDAFPTRIEVEKTERGSILSVS